MNKREEIKSIADKVRSLDTMDQTVQSLKRDIEEKLRFNKVSNERASVMAQRCAEVIREEFGGIEDEVAEFLGQLSRNNVDPTGSISLDQQVEMKLDEMAAKDESPVSERTVQRRRKKIIEDLTKTNK